VPVTALLDTVKFFEQMEKMLSRAGMPEESNDYGREDVFRWVNRAQEVARAIQSYRIPLVEIKTNNLSIAVESFSRLNKKGRSIGQDEMFSALTYEEAKQGAFHLAAEIDKLQQDMIRSGFGEVDRAILLRAVLSAANLDIYRTDWTSLGDQIKKEVRGQLPEAVLEASKGLSLAREFLREIGVLNGRMLPYSMQLVALSAFYGRCANPTVTQRALLERWFWSSSFAGWFGSNNPTSVRRLVDEFRDDISKNPTPKDFRNMRIDQPALPTPLRFDMRSARVRATLCVLLTIRPRGLDGQEVGLEESARLLFERGPEAMRTVCATVKNADLRRSPANRILDVNPDSGGQAKNWILELTPEIRDQILTSHAIEPDSFKLLKSGKNDEFLQQRMRTIAALERSFMQKVRVTTPETDDPAASPIDTDDTQPQGSL